MTRSDIEEQVGVALADHTGGDVHTEQLLARVTTRGRAMRNHRRALAAAAIVAMVTLGVGTAVAIPQLSGDGGVSPALRRITQVPAPPAVENRPGMAEEIGSNPLRIHFRLAGIPALPVAAVDWESSEDYEGVQLFGDDRSDALASVALTSSGRPLMYWSIGKTASSCGIRILTPGSSSGPSEVEGCVKRLSEEPVTVSGKPGTLTSYGRDDRVLWRTLTWTAIPRITGHVFADDDVTSEEILGLAAAVRTDRVSRCAVPFRLSHLPAGTAVTDCRMTLSVDGRSANGALDLANTGAGGGLEVVPWRGVGDPPQQKLVHATPLPDRPPASRDQANRQVNGKLALWTNHPDGPGNEKAGQLLLFAADDLTVEFCLWGGYGETEAMAVAAGYHPAGGNDPADWPADPLS